MEQINLAQQEKARSLRDKIGRALRLSIVPLALLAAGCGREGDFVSLNPISEKPKIGLSENEIDQKESDQKILLECLVQVSGSPQGVETLDDGDLAILIDDEAYRIDDGAKEKILTIIKENDSESGLGLNFEKTEIKFQTIAVEKEIIKSCPKISLDQLTTGLKEILKVKEELQQLTKPNQENNSYETKDGDAFHLEGGHDHSQAETKTNPDIKDFL